MGAPQPRDHSGNNAWAALLESYVYLYVMYHNLYSVQASRYLLRPSLTGCQAMRYVLTAHM